MEQEVRQDHSRTKKILLWFNRAGLLHTLISISIFVLSTLNWWNGGGYYKIIQILSTVTIANSVVWVVTGLLLILLADNLDTGYSTGHIRFVLFIAIWLVLTPDIITMTVFYIPELKGADFINWIAMASPLLVFLGWIIGKHLGKRAR